MEMAGKSCANSFPEGMRKSGVTSQSAGSAIFLYELVL
jgi:hypothetical protein